MVIYCCSDLIFATKIRSTAETLGVASRPARDVETLRRRLEQVDDGKGNEPVAGVMVDLDLAQTALDLIAATRQFSAELPIVAFGSHVATELLESARRTGADFVMPRSQFTATLPMLLERFDQTAA